MVKRKSQDVYAFQLFSTRLDRLFHPFSQRLPCLVNSHVFAQYRLQTWHRLQPELSCPLSAGTAMRPSPCLPFWNIDVVSNILASTGFYLQLWARMCALLVDKCLTLWPRPTSQLICQTWSYVLKLVPCQQDPNQYSLHRNAIK